jgi:ABC-type sugar transport system substrate-binding protein
MKTRITLLLLLIALLLLSTGASALSAPPRYRLETGTLSGGYAPLARSGVQAEAVSAGGAYRLETRSAPSAQANGGCCCAWAPCVLSNH